MKKFCILLTALFLGLSAGAQTPFQITFGPYLQNVTADGATVIWGTSADALSWVEAAPDGEDHFYAEERPQYYQTKLGKRTVGRLHTVRITGLKPASFYRYRVCSREVTELQPYKVSYGQTICSDVYRKKPYRFKTRDAAQQSVSFTVVNDIHENSDMLATLLSDVKKEQRDFVFFLAQSRDAGRLYERRRAGRVVLVDLIHGKNQLFRRRCVAKTPAGH